MTWRDPNWRYHGATTHATPESFRRRMRDRAGDMAKVVEEPQAKAKQLTRKKA